MLRITKKEVCEENRLLTFPKNFHRIQFSLKMFHLFSCVRRLPASVPPFSWGTCPQAPAGLDMKLKPTISQVLLINVFESGMIYEFSTDFIFCSDFDDDFIFFHDSKHFLNFLSV